MNALSGEESLDDFLILIFPHADGYTVITVCGAYSCPVGLEELTDVINIENIINSPTVMYTLRGGLCDIIFCKWVHSGPSLHLGKVLYLQLLSWLAHKVP